MNMQTESKTKKTAVFDESGNTVEEFETQPEETAIEETEDQTETEETETPAAEPGKYRIGDKTFDTQEEALAYATSQVSAIDTENQIADAYRQGLLDAQNKRGLQAQNVTPQENQEPELNADELYTNPQAFLEKYANKIKTETRAEIDQRDNLKAESDRIWREFSDRHPALADFRQEVEDFVSKNVTDVRAIISTKGRPASYDFIATKIKSRFQAYANAMKPKRELSNAKSDASPSSKAASVTPKPDPKKALSFADQLRTMRKKR